MTPRLALSLGLAVSALAAHASWNVSEKADPMTDIKHYFVSTAADPIAISDLVNYSPLLAIEVVPEYYDASTDRMSFSIVPTIVLDIDSFDTGTSDVLVRFDSSPAEPWKVVGTSDLNVGVVMSPREFSSRLFGASTLLFRYTTIIGHTRTARFDISGYRDALVDIKARAKDSLPPPPTVETPKPVKLRTCPKCHGKGEISSWTKCPKCGGKGMLGSRRCPKCVKSAKRGHVKTKTACPTCDGTGKIPKK